MRLDNCKGRTVNERNGFPIRDKKLFKAKFTLKRGVIYTAQNQMEKGDEREKQGQKQEQK